MKIRKLLAALTTLLAGLFCVVSAHADAQTDEDAAVSNYAAEVRREHEKAELLSLLVFFQITFSAV